MEIGKSEATIPNQKVDLLRLDDHTRSYLAPQSLEALPPIPVIQSWLDNTLSAPPHYQTPAFKKYKADWIEAFFLISNPDRLEKWAGGMTQREREDEERRIKKAELEKADRLKLFGSTYGYS